MFAHELEADFPSYRAVMARLRSADETFASLAARYDEVNREVVVLEEMNVPTDDFTFEKLKKQRVLLKDEIYSRLRAYVGAPDTDGAARART
jgi:uncharacterized protein YdcH (DUF465 family)